MDVPLEKRIQEHIKMFLDWNRISDEFLEIGCGDGFNLEYFSNLGFCGKGIDISAPSIEVAKSRKLKGINVECCNLFEFVGPKISLVLLLNVLEHIENDKEVLQKISRLMQAEGVFVLAVPGKKGTYGYADKKAGHYRRYERAELHLLLKEAQFEIMDVLSVGFPVCNIYTWLYNHISQVIYGEPEFNVKANATIGQEHQVGHLSPIFRAIAPWAFVVLSALIRIDVLFKRTNLGNNYIVFAKKKNDK